MIIESFKNYSEDLENKRVIDENAYIDNTYSNGERYQHILEFVIPYHENKTISIDKQKSVKGSAYEITKSKLKFDDFEKKFGGLGTGLVRRTSVRSTYVFQGQVKVNSDDFNEDWSKSLRENIPFYVLKYVTIKNGEKRYSEDGLNQVKKEFPEIIYRKEIN